MKNLASWLTESPDAQVNATTTPARAPTATTDTPAGGAPRPRKAERRQARQAAFYQARRGAAATPRQQFEVATDQVRALGNDRALTAATTALDQILTRFTP